MPLSSVFYVSLMAFPLHRIAQSVLISFVFPYVFTWF